jgi:hypothetical protein
MTIISKDEYEHTILGVSGIMKHRNTNKDNTLWRSAKFTAIRPVPKSAWGPNRFITVTIRFDDRCGNGQHSFSITGDIGRKGRDFDCGGCIHDEIKKYFPELKGLIQYHLSDTRGPMHYISNTCYMAGNLDSNGKAKGEADRFEHSIKFDSVPVSHIIGKRFYEFLKAKPEKLDLEIEEIKHESSTSSGTYYTGYSVKGFDCTWPQSPFKSKLQAEQTIDAINNCKIGFELVATNFSEGKDRDLTGARNSANWPEASDLQLCLPRKDLEKLLNARLEGMQKSMRETIEAIGFDWDLSSYNK